MNRQAISIFALGAISSLAASCAVIPPASPPAPVRYIDAHSHILAQMTPAEEVSLLRASGISAAVIMHPDIAAIDAMRAGNAGFIVPAISLARLPQMPGLHLGPDAAPAMARLADAGEACGFGEIPTRIVPRTEPTDDLSLLGPDRVAIYAAADARGLVVSMHVDIADPKVEASIARIARDYPRAKVVLAHSGWSAAPEVIARLMDAYPNVHGDLSVRLDPAGGLPMSVQPANSLPPGATNVISILQPDGTIQPAWRDLLLRHADRFLFAMDITDEQRPKFAQLLVATARKALGTLGPAAENAIAHGNAERLYAGCARGFAARD
ncbi:amidohydrolase family protein [Novosphingobium flavum]|uniref:Amidohydrolase family protein n=1 Tax=Novosphingobium flavum TaxID=1778672 RepID=A0A7X1FSY4_9SPHN|nr:amidohydrolase family protein [Novosphingobium flavum]MBC2666279.1 amidohydrolase family protein [Novosphingobium flavum]